jgi:hypothetical protein
MRFHLLPDPWLETEVAHLEDASAVDFKVVFFLEAGRHRFLVEILVFGARPSVSQPVDGPEIPISRCTRPPDMGNTAWQQFVLPTSCFTFTRPLQERKPAACFQALWSCMCVQPEK